MWIQDFDEINQYLFRKNILIDYTLSLAKKLIYEFYGVCCRKNNPSELEKKLSRPASSSILLLLTPRHVLILESGAFQRVSSNLTPSFLRRPSFPRPPQHLRSLSSSFLLLCQPLPQNPSCHLLHLFIPLYSSPFIQPPTIKSSSRAENTHPLASRTDTPEGSG